MAAAAATFALCAMERPHDLLPLTLPATESLPAVTAIRLDNVGLVFHAHRHGRISLKEYLLHGLFRRHKRNSFQVQALEGINLEVGEGERVGIIGGNGGRQEHPAATAGGHYPPATGHCEVHGRISSLFDLALGFESDASGWDNVRYRGYLQGETPR